jgi:transcriptional regulator with XRE-family HTH domain
MDALLEPVAEPLRRFGYDGRKLRELRKARPGLTQAALADLAGVVRQRVAQWEGSSSEALSERDLQRYLSAINAYDASSQPGPSEQ